jgi:exonuclease
VEHRATLVNGLWHCEICGWRFKHPPEATCPGVKRYAWATWPPELLTKQQLYDAGFSTGKTALPKPAGVCYRAKSPGGWMWLYNKADGVPRKPLSEARKEAMKKAAFMAAMMTISCRSCGQPTATIRRKVYLADPAHFDGQVCVQCADRGAAIRWARDMLALGAQLVILDTETTGLNEADPIQIAVIDGAGATLVNTYVFTEKPIEPGAYRVHGISPEKIADAPRFAAVYPLLAAAVNGKTLVIYHRAFDMPMLNRVIAGLDLPPLAPAAKDCAMIWYAQFVNDWSDYFKSYKYQKLGGSHDALDDCQRVLSLLHLMVKFDPEKPYELIGLAAEVNDAG